MNIFEVQGTFMLVVTLVLLAIKAYAFASSLMFSAEAYDAAGKLTKVAWVAITGLGFAAAVIIASPLNLIGIAATVAALVYLADVRPALRDVTAPR